jgi:hypothetical protein
VTSIPPTWIERWRGKFRTWLQRAVNCRQGADPTRWSKPACREVSSSVAGNQESTD